MTPRLLLTLLFIGSLFAARPASASVLLELAGGYLATAGGTAIPSGSGLLVLVASTGDASFTPLSSTSSLIVGSAVSPGSDDVVLWKATVSGDGNQDGSATAGEFRQAVDLAYAGAVAEGNPVILYWFPTLNTSTTTVGTGVAYGSYRSAAADADGSEAWSLPADGTAGKVLLLLTAGAGSAVNPALTGAAFSVTDGIYTGATDPVANSDTAQVSGPTVLDLLANDTDPNGYPLTITAVTQPVQGTAALSGGVVTYTPDASASGTDTFTYTISNGHNGTASALVTLTITSTPVTTVSPAGRYRALLTVSGLPAGAVSAVVTSGGTVTGRVAIQGRSYVLRGKLGDDHTFTQTIARAGKAALVVTLTFGADANGHPTVTASIAGDAVNYIATASAALATAPLANAPAGRYNLLLPGGMATGQPAGTGWVTLRLTGKAAVVGVGRLPDARVVSLSSHLRQDGAAAFSTSLAYGKSRGSFSGTLLFDTTGTSGDVSGTFTHLKPAVSAGRFSDGFTLNGAVTGDLYVAPAAGVAPLGSTAATAATVTFSGAELPAALAQPVTISANGATTRTAPLTVPLRLQLLRASGVVTGAFTPDGGVSTAFSGVILHRSDDAAGLFSGTSQTGSFTVIPQ